MTDIISQIMEYSKEYPVIVGGAGIWLLGVLTYFGKWLPWKVYNILLRNITTQLTIMSSHNSYHDFLKWYEEKGFSKTSRSVKMSNGRYGYDDTIKGVGYGTHYFWIGWRLVRLVLTKMETKTDRELDKITLTTLGRSHKAFDKIFNEIKLKKQGRDKISLMKYKDGWRRASSQRKRSIDTVYLNRGIKSQILNFIENFKNNESFHLKHGISHQTALMLYGPPGTGKTSLIKALASHFDMDIYRLNVNALKVIEDAFASLPENALVVIEDIDSDISLFSREEDNEDGIRIQPIFSNMSDVLNTIDGLNCSHGRILIATTNYIDKLDPALLRAGRFDLKVKVDYADNFALNSFSNRFYDRDISEELEIKSTVCPADIQNYILQKNRTFDEFIDKFCEIKTKKIVWK